MQSIRVIMNVLALTALCSPGCERGAPPAKPTSTQPAGTQPTASEMANVREFMQVNSPRGAAALPQGHPPVGDTAARPTTLPAELSRPPVPLKYAAPETWQREPVKSGMRIDQYRLPRAEGDTEDAELAVTANIGGGIEANIERWRAQFSSADGGPVPDSAFAREQLEAPQGLKITLVDVTGRYAGAAMGSPGASAAKENYRMLAAIVETPGGPWFFKATGPAATIGKHRQAFVEFLRTMKLE